MQFRTCTYNRPYGFASDNFRYSSYSRCGLRVRANVLSPMNELSGHPYHAVESLLHQELIAKRAV